VHSLHWPGSITSVQQIRKIHCCCHLSPWYRLRYSVIQCIFVVNQWWALVFEKRWIIAVVWFNAKSILHFCLSTRFRINLKPTPTLDSQFFDQGFWRDEPTIRNLSDRRKFWIMFRNYPHGAIRNTINVPYVE
jgi:hypothetical protein